VARTGTTAPGTSTTFSAFGAVVIDSNGAVSFNASLADGGSGIFTDAGGTLALVARTGDAAPGTSSTFSQFGVRRSTATA
jgi:hypothetical protein